MAKPPAKLIKSNAFNLNDNEDKSAHAFVNQTRNWPAHCPYTYMGARGAAGIAGASFISTLTFASGTALAICSMLT